MCYNISMKLIIGLGNPGNEYNFTRHNYGFLALDFYAKTHQLTWQKPKFGALWVKTGDRIFVKPQTFYNDSGLAVAAFARFYKVNPADILIICDDFELEFGKNRYRKHGSAGTNNGLKSVTSHLKTELFPRLRLGTGNDQLRHQIGDVDFVLGHFTATEKEQLPALLTAISAKIDELTL